MNRTRQLFLVLVMFFTIGVSAAVAAQAETWRADWEQTLASAKKEGQLTLYGSPDFEGLFGEFHKKYPEIKIMVCSIGAPMWRSV